jgi:hypothetical protein
MNKLRKIENHVRRHREKYLLAVGVVIIIVLYHKKEYWHNNAKELGHEIVKMEDFMNSHDVLIDFLNHDI